MSGPNPPKWALSFLRWYCRSEYLDEIEGDLFEFYYLRSKDSKRSANLFFIWNVFRSFRLINLKNTQNNNWTMNLLKNYTKIYFRRFRKETAHYVVNILGLSMGFSILFFILMYVYDEQNMDAFHTKRDRVYRVVTEISEEDGKHNYISTPGPLAQALKDEFPVIEQTAHLTYSGSQVLGVGETQIADRYWAMATKEIFDILDIEIIQGNPKKQFSGPAGLILTEDLAMRLFGSTDVVGKVVEESNFGPSEVLAVMKEMPRNSTYKFNNIYVTNYDQFPEGWKRFINSWGGRFTETWVLLKENTAPQSMMSSMDAFREKYIPEEERDQIQLSFQNIEDIHLQSVGYERGGMAPRVAIPYSDQEFVSIILMMGFLVIFIAALNYVNLSSVQALKRTLEASMRKINGANNKHLLVQLFFETLLTVIISYAISIALIALLFPFFLSIADKEFNLSLLFTLDFIPYHVGAIVIIWTISALLPAIYYSQLKRQLLIVKNTFSGKGDLLRKGLVGVQYALSIFLIIGSLVIYRQLNYVQSKELGFDLKNLIVLDINSGNARREFKNIVNGILDHPNVINASSSSRVPGEWKNLPSARVGQTLTDGLTDFSHYAADYRWLDTYDFKLLEGRNFSGADEQDSLNIIINQKAVELLGLENAIGSGIWVGSDRDTVKMNVIGVVENFHFQSLYEEIGPVILTSWNNHVRSIDYFTIRYSNAENLKATLDHIETVNASFDPGTPPEINFLDEQWNRFYKAEQSRATIILIASIVSIIISAFGLYGLINFTVERKTKEIGIRKVMGASVGNIIQLILKDYLILLLISLVIAAPLSWWLFGKWLADFAYRIHLGADLFAIAFGIVLFISFITVLTRIFKIAKGNPVNSIRCE